MFIEFEVKNKLLHKNNGIIVHEIQIENFKERIIVVTPRFEESNEYKLLKNELENILFKIMKKNTHYTNAQEYMILRNFEKEKIKEFKELENLKRDSPLILITRRSDSYLEFKIANYKKIDFDFLITGEINE